MSDIRSRPSRGGHFKLGSLSIVKLKDGTNSGMTEGPGPGDTKRSGKFSNRKGEKNIINKRSLDGTIFATSAKRNSIKRSFLTKGSEASIKGGRKGIVIDISVEITHDNTGLDFLSGNIGINPKKKRSMILTMFGINVVEGDPSALKKDFNSQEHTFVVPNEKLLRRRGSRGSE